MQSSFKNDDSLSIKTKFNLNQWQDDRNIEKQIEDEFNVSDDSLCALYSLIFIHNIVNMKMSYADATDWDENESENMDLM